MKVPRYGELSARPHSLIYGVVIIARQVAESSVCIATAAIAVLKIGDFDAMGDCLVVYWSVWNPVSLHEGTKPTPLTVAFSHSTMVA